LPKRLLDIDGPAIPREASKYSPSAEELDSLTAFLSRRLCSLSPIPDRLDPHPSYNPADYVNQKHRLQRSQLLNLVPDVALDDVVVVELGAGKGELSRRFQQAHGCPKGLSFVLIDRINFRAISKFDSDMVKDGAFVHREVADISAVDIVALLKSLGMTGKTVVFVIKHLCGCAFDYALEVIKRVTEAGWRCHGSVAPCCHWLVESESLCLSRTGPISPRADEEGSALFERLLPCLRFVTTWATLNEKAADWESKKRLGRQAKEFIDRCRREWLQEVIGRPVQLSRFTEESTDNLAMSW
jgi:hypothetical protein